MPILMKRKNGEITPYRNSEYITAYLLLPEVILERCPSALHLPRKASSYFLDWDVIEVVESDLFLLLIIDAYAYLVWPYLGVKGFMEAYSGFDPIYGVAHSPGIWVQEMLDQKYICSTGTFYKRSLELFHQRKDDTLDYTPIPVINAILEKIVPSAMKRHHLYEMIEAVKEMRCPEDFDYRPSHQKIDFYRAWYHTRSPHAECSLEKVREKQFNLEESGAANSNRPFLHTPFKQGFSDRSAEDAIIERLDRERFQASLTPTDQQILELRTEGRTMEEIAKAVGFETHSAVQKRLKKIRNAYQEYNQMSS